MGSLGHTKSTAHAPSCSLFEVGSNAVSLVQESSLSLIFKDSDIRLLRDRAVEIKTSPAGRWGGGKNKQALRLTVLARRVLLNFCCTQQACMKWCAHTNAHCICIPREFRRHQWSRSRLPQFSFGVGRGVITFHSLSLLLCLLGFSFTPPLRSGFVAPHSSPTRPITRHAQRGHGSVGTATVVYGRRGGDSHILLEATDMG